MKKNPVAKELVSQFFRKNHCAFFSAFFVTIVTSTFGLVVSWLLKELIDMMAGESRFTMTQIFYIVLGVVVADIAFMVLSYYSEPHFIRRAMRQYKAGAFSYLSKKNIASFQKESSASYLSALTNDATTIENSYLGQIMMIISKILAFFGSLILMLYYSPILTGFVILILLLPTMVSAVMGKKMQKAQKEVSDRNSAFTAAMTDCLGGFTVIKSFRAEEEALKIFSEENDKLEEAKCRLRKIGVVAGNLGMMAGMTAQMGVFLMGTYLAMSGKGLTPGSVMLFVNLMNFLISPVSELPKLLAGKKAASALIDKLAESLSENKKTEGDETVGTIGEGIRFRNVSFSYDGEKEVLHDIDCDFKPGKSYAIVGGSGSGKSTLLNLLLSGNNTYKGDISVDGKELKDISADSLYDLMTVIQQNVFIFNSTIRDNVTMFRDFPSEKVEAAMRKAHLLPLVSERGEDYRCGENGNQLSGGEKQRISIARSLLKESSVLLADEVTSALDAQTSCEVINGILDLEDVTRIVVTHTLEESLLRRYDEILVVRNGTIEEKGSFEDLMQKNGYFKALFTVSK